MWILVPVLTEKESDFDFVESLKSNEKIVLLFVVDESLKEVPAGFVGSRIKSAELIIEKIKNLLPSNITVKDYVEWGSWHEKIENIAKLEEIDKVVMIQSRKSESLLPFLKASGVGYELFKLQQ